MIGVGLSAISCKLSTPNGFLDAFPAALTSTNIRNISTNLTTKTPDLYSGFVIGTLPADATMVKVAFDDGAYKSATIDGSTWKIALPTGSDAAAGTKRWMVGSKHTLYAKSFDAQGNTKMASPYSLSFVRQQNRDVNGDGYGDIVTGAYLNSGASAAGGQSAGNAGRGAAYVFYGSATGLMNRPESATAYFCSGPPDCNVVANPDNKGNSNFGLNNAAIAGDVNGDGYADIVVGASANNGANAAGGQIAGATGKGAAYIFYGSATGVTNHPENAAAYFCSGAPDCSVVQNPDNYAGAFGYAVAGAGDVNGDGYNDVIIGANVNNGTGATGGQSVGLYFGLGAAYIFYGSATGITNHPENASAYFCSGAPDCSVIENPDQHNNGSNSAEFGHSVATAGDINGDGYGDVIVGAVGNDGRPTVAGGQVWGGDSKGAAYIFYGSSTGITNHPENATAYFCSGPPDCSVIQNPDNLNTAAASFGSGVAGGSDINGDGYHDVVIGAYFNDGTGAASPQTSSGNQKGAAYVFYGTANGITNHPENNSAYLCSGPSDCNVVGNPDNKGAGGGNFGMSVAMLGDTNGDGYADILVGGPVNDGTSAAAPQTAGTTGKGAAYIFYGSSTGIKNHLETATPYYCSGAPDCSVVENPDNAGAGPGNFGTSVAMAGDINADGFADLIVGAPVNSGTSSTGGQSAGAASKGSAYLFFGASTGITNHPLNASPYFCAGTTDCAVIQNPDNSGGKFGNGVGWLAPALRPSHNLWREELTLMLRREEVEV